MSLKVLGEQVNVCEGTMARHSKSGGWPAKRIQYQTNLVEADLEQSKEITLVQRLEFDTRTSIICDAIMGQLAIYLADIQAEEDVLTLGTMSSMATIVKQVQDVKYRQLDVPPPVKRLEHTQPTSPGDDIQTDISNILNDMRMSDSSEFDESAG